MNGDGLVLFLAVVVALLPVAVEAFVVVVGVGVIVYYDDQMMVW